MVPFWSVVYAERPMRNWALAAQVYVLLVCVASVGVAVLGVIVLLTNWVDAPWLWASAVAVGALGAGSYYFDATFTRFFASGEEPRYEAVDDPEEEAAARSYFEALVEEAYAAIPAELRPENVEIVVEDEPPENAPVLGRYQGVPLTSRGVTFRVEPVFPDRIVIYRGPLERESLGDSERLRIEVKRTVLHEVAHHFGITDERLLEIDRY
jgi:predicted Zn-dependent protease with MMP-like domain